MTWDNAGMGLPLSMSVGRFVTITDEDGAAYNGVLMSVQATLRDDGGEPNITCALEYVGPKVTPLVPVGEALEVSRRERSRWRWQALHDRLSRA